MKVSIGYLAAQEQYTPSQLLEHAVLADEYGFDSIWTSDHFLPWVHTRAKCGFAWVWLAAAAERTRQAMIGTGVTAPILRYNPAIVAQAFATLGAMYPGRVFLGIGTGEALNEIPVGMGWPSFKERSKRLEEAAQIIRLLWTTEWVTFNGKYFKLRKANLYTKPPRPVPLYIAASGPTVARIAGKYADGFITLPFPEDHYRNVLFPEMEKGAREKGRDPSKIEKIMEMQVSYDEEYPKAVQAARWWAPTVMPVFFKYGISDPREIEAHGNLISEEGLKTGWFISADLDEHIREIERYVKLGFTNIHIQSSSPDEKKFIKTFGTKVLPYIKNQYKDV
jgi:coenzyme F420-dependent glucose-6-phosphate dehydrogenase